MIELCEEYLKWFSHRTIICSLRDLIREYPFSWNGEPVPESQVERYGKEKKYVPLFYKVCNYMIY